MCGSSTLFWCGDWSLMCFYYTTIDCIGWVQLLGLCDSYEILCEYTRMWKLCLSIQDGGPSVRGIQYTKVVSIRDSMFVCSSDGTNLSIYTIMECDEPIVIWFEKERGKEHLEVIYMDTLTQHRLGWNVFLWGFPHLLFGEW